MKLSKLQQVNGLRNLLDKIRNVARVRDGERGIVITIIGGGWEERAHFSEEAFIKALRKFLREQDAATLEKMSELGVDVAA